MKWASRVMCRWLGHIPEPDLDKKGRLLIRCRTCRKDITP